MSKVNKISTRLVVNSLIQQTIEVEVQTDAGVFRAALPFFKPFEYATISNYQDVVKTQLSPIITGMSLSDWQKTEQLLDRFSYELQIPLYGAILQATAAYNRLPTIKFIQKLSGAKTSIPRLILPLITGKKFSVAEYGITFKPGTEISMQINAYAAISQKLLEFCTKYNGVYEKGVIRVDTVFDSEEPIKAITQAIRGLKLDCAGMALTFEPKSYEKGNKFDVHVKQDTAAREAMTATEFAGMMNVWLLGNPIFYIQNITSQLCDELDNVLKKFQQLSVCGTPLKAKNTTTVMLKDYKQYKQILELPKQPHQKVFIMDGESEDVGLAHILTGLGFDYIKVQPGAQSTAKVGELARIDSALK